MDWPSASLFRVTPRRAAARGSVDRVLLVCFAVDARVGLLVAHRVVDDACGRLLVAVRGVLDEFLLAELKPLRLTAARLLDRHALLAPSLGELVGGVGRQPRVHARTVLALCRPPFGCRRMGFARAPVEHAPGASAAPGPAQAGRRSRALALGEPPRRSSSSAASMASSSQSIFAGQGFSGWSSSVFSPLPVMIATTVSSGPKRPPAASFSSTAIVVPPAGSVRMPSVEASRSMPAKISGSLAKPPVPPRLRTASITR